MSVNHLNSGGNHGSCVDCLNSSLFEAVRSGHLGLVRHWIHNGARVDFANPMAHEASPLHLAARHNRIDIARHLLRCLIENPGQSQQPAEPVSSDFPLTPCLMHRPPLKGGQTYYTTFHDTEDKDFGEWTAAAADDYGRRTPAQDKLKLNPVDCRGRTPLTYAIHWEHQGMIKLLLGTPGTDPWLEDDLGEGPVSHAIGGDDETTIENVLSGVKGHGHGIDVGAKVNGSPLVTLVAMRGNPVVLKMLLEAGFAFDPEKDIYGFTPESGIENELASCDDSNRRERLLACQDILGLAAAR
ncbi:hypothetical protein PCL_08645 [Purpureocillium lilacinum]|uniref:Ankyrin repeats (3 copies) domain-containing protein n=1 Tax=Purpureocillium lilacinum TaxID=33203 RepID=A0A2U3DR46_PURLI|nr:hypothetical protein PCL_08645 [Purpureocillium lilacinum]